MAMAIDTGLALAIGTDLALGLSGRAGHSAPGAGAPPVDAAGWASGEPTDLDLDPSRAGR
jgi:hypothetical protein